MPPPRVEPKNFDWWDLPNPTLRGFVLYCDEQDRGTPVPDFLSAQVLYSDLEADSTYRWIVNAHAVQADLKSYRLVHAHKTGTLRRAFYFSPNLAREVAQTPFRLYYNTEPTMHWPAVLSAIYWFKRLDGSYISRPRYKNAYSGPTRVRYEEFYSPVEFEIPIYEQMMERGVNEELGYSHTYTIPPGDGNPFWFSVGSLNLIPCLHPAIAVTVPLVPNVTIDGTTYTSASLSAPATNYTDWPDEIVIDDRQRQVVGGWLRRRLTALKPMIVRVTSPTSASITSSGATLGGTVSVEDGAVVASRGVVYALTSADANPELGNSSVGSVATSGTTGVFTAAVTGLLSGRQYSFKAYAMTSQGVAVYSAAATFTTS